MSYFSCLEKPYLLCISFISFLLAQFFFLGLNIVKYTLLIFLLNSFISKFQNKLKPIPVNLEIEPSFMAVGPYHLVVGMNNNTWFYDLTRSQPESEDSPLKLKTKQYMGAVSSVKLNAEYAAVLFEGKIHLHLVRSYFLYK